MVATKCCRIMFQGSPLFSYPTSIQHLFSHPRFNWRVMRGCCLVSMWFYNLCLKSNNFLWHNREKLTTKQTVPLTVNWKEPSQVTPRQLRQGQSSDSSGQADNSSSQIQATTAIDGCNGSFGTHIRSRTQFPQQRGAEAITEAEKVHSMHWNFRHQPRIHGKQL